MEVDGFSRFEELSIHAPDFEISIRIVQLLVLFFKTAIHGLCWPWWPWWSFWLFVVTRNKKLKDKQLEFISGRNKVFFSELPCIFKDGISFDFTAVESPHSPPRRMCWMNIYCKRLWGFFKMGMIRTWFRTGASRYWYLNAYKYKWLLVFVQWHKTLQLWKAWKICNI